jgi:uncharacterized protein (TIGR01440 family)
MNIRAQAAAALEELANENRAHFNPVRLLAIGCSSSEIAGGVIGNNSTYPLGEAVADAVLEAAAKFGFDPAFQCCEHLNRALVMERDAAEKYGCTIVCAVPRPKAGGSLATAAWKRMKAPVLVERVQADAGIDIGLTLIGMHLKPVAVPVRLQTTHIGNAIVTAARTRPKLIGGERAAYTEE